MLFSSPLISVITPVYNQANFLSESLSSLFAQTYSNWESIIIDDGSTDETEDICLTFMEKDSRFHYIKQENQGPSAARNKGIQHSKGSFICFLDADDRFESEKIERQLEIFNQNPSIDIVYTAIYIIDETGKRIGEYKDRSYPIQDFLTYQFFRNVIPNPNTIIAKRDCLIHYSYNESFKHAEDYELMVRLAHYYQFYYLDLPLTSYRRHPSNLSNDLAAHRQAELKVLQQYPPEHIKHIVDSSSLGAMDKELMKGKILFNRESFQEASVIFQALKTSLSYFYLGNCYIQQQLFDQAKQAYIQSLQMDKTNAACYNNLGAVYTLLNQSQEGAFYFEKALQLKPSYLDAKFNLEQASKGKFIPKITFKELRKDLLPYI